MLSSHVLLSSSRTAGHPAMVVIGERERYAKPGALGDTLVQLNAVTQDTSRGNGIAPSEEKGSGNTDQGAHSDSTTTIHHLHAVVIPSFQPYLTGRSKSSQVVGGTLTTARVIGHREMEHSQADSK